MSLTRTIPSDSDNLTHMIEVLVADIELTEADGYSAAAEWSILSELSDRLEQAKADGC